MTHPERFGDAGRSIGMEDRFCVADVMTRPVQTIVTSASIADAAARLADGVGSLVVTENGTHVGIVTKTDVVAAFARGEPGRTAEGNGSDGTAGTDGSDGTAGAVGDVMSSPLTTVRAEDSVIEAALVLAGRGVAQAPVLGEDDALVGVVSVRDLAYYVPDLRFRADRPWGEQGSVPDADVDAGVAAADRHGHVRRPGRVDTAYEEARWSFEYDGGDGIAVGDVARFSKPVTEADVEEFAHATGDTNRLHLDESFAADTRFGRQIAHGVLTLGLVSAALARMPGVIIYLSQDCTYLGPVALDAEVTATCEVVEDLGGDRYRLDVQASTVDGEDVLSGGSTILVDEIPS